MTDTLPGEVILAAPQQRHDRDDNRLNIVDLPAGSGKTTQIHSRVTEHHRQHPEDNILAITYTNRAVTELQNRLKDTANVTVTTIHGFISEQLTPFFSCHTIVDYFFEWRKNAIEDYIANPKNQERLQKFQDRNGYAPSFDAIKEHTTKISYSRRAATSPLYPSLSHDELLAFFVSLTGEYRMFRQRIGRKYQLIVIDECQDTNPDVLQVFVDIAKEHLIQLWVYGDMMQQIFNKQEEELYKVLGQFTPKPPATIINYRSRPRIVAMLNGLYKNEQYQQTWDCERYPQTDPEDDKSSILQVLISDNPQHTMERLQQEHNALALVVFNRERFKNYGIDELFAAYSECACYKYGNERTAVDVLLPPSIEQRDDLDHYILTLIDAKQLLDASKNGAARRLIAANAAFFAPSGGKHQRDLPLRHEDLINHHKRLQQLTDCLATQFCTVKTLLEKAEELELINKDWYRQLSDKQDILTHLSNVPIEQFRKQHALLTMPKWQHTSTQHGVKGESHDSVVILVEDSPQYPPFLYMYDCIEIISKTDDFNLDYIRRKQSKIRELSSSCSEKVTPITGNNVAPDQSLKDPKSFKQFAAACEQSFMTDGTDIDRLVYQLYVKRITKKTSKKQQKATAMPLSAYLSRLAAAYRVFYVCCSRARKELYIVMDRNKVSEYESELRTKFSNFGFDILDGQSTTRRSTENHTNTKETRPVTNRPRDGQVTA